MKRTLAQLIVALGCCLAGAQSNELPPVASTSATGTNAAGSGSGYVLDDKHKLVPGDRVSFQIVEDRTNSIPMLVAESSELDVPYIGRVSVQGKTCRQAAAGPGCR